MISVLKFRRLSIFLSVTLIMGGLTGNIYGSDQLRDRIAEIAEAEARFDLFSGTVLVAKDGEVFVSVNGSVLQEERIIDRAKRVLSDIEGIRKINIGVEPSIYVPF